MSAVINLFDAKAKREAEKEDAPAVVEETDLEAAMRRNKENEERLRRERASANRTVKRQYRII